MNWVNADSAQFGGMGGMKTEGVGKGAVRKVFKERFKACLRSDRAASWGTKWGLGSVTEGKSRGARIWFGGLSAAKLKKEEAMDRREKRVSKKRSNDLTERESAYRGGGGRNKSC